MIGCNRQEVIICSPDDTNCITVMTRAFSDIRYVIDGRHTNIPDTNYVKIKISDHYRPGDTIYVCWNNQDYEWEAIVDKSIIIDNKLNENRFLFSNTIDKDPNGVPTVQRYRKPGCASIGLYNEVNLYVEGTAIIYQ